MVLGYIYCIYTLYSLLQRAPCSLGTIPSPNPPGPLSGLIIYLQPCLFHHINPHPIPRVTFFSILIVLIISQLLLLLHNSASIRLRHNPLLISLDITREFLHRATITDPETRAHRLQHRHIVTNHQYSSLKISQRKRQGVHGFNVEVIRRFVENEDMRVCETEAGECNAGFLTAGKEFHFLEASHAGDAEATKEEGC